MFIIKEKKKNVSIVKIVLIVAGILAAVAAVGAALMVWKKKCCKDKQIEEEIDAAIDAAFTEDEAAEVEVVEA